MPVIKRYPNRKLYNTASKQYITLEEISHLIRQGEEIHVVDHATGEDLTAVTLTQIIFEEEKKPGGFLPRHVLHGLIQSGGDRLSAVQRTLVSSLGINRLIDDEIGRRIEALVQSGDLSPEEGESLSLKLLGPQAAPPAPPQSMHEEVVERVLNERGVPGREDLQRLIEQIDELAARLNQETAPQEPPFGDDPE